MLTVWRWCWRTPLIPGKSQLSASWLNFDRSPVSVLSQLLLMRKCLMFEELLLWNVGGPPLSDYCEARLHAATLCVLYGFQWMHYSDYKICLTIQQRSNRMLFRGWSLPEGDFLRHTVFQSVFLNWIVFIQMSQCLFSLADKPLHYIHCTDCRR